MTEQLKYQVLRNFADFEVRRYPDYVLVQIEADGDFNRASFRAFNPLVNYISGGNLSGKSIAMTAPVIQETISENKHLVSFVLPDSVSIDDIPVPANAKLSTKVIKSHDVAAIKYRGSWREQLVNQYAAKLKKGIAKANLESRGSIYVARFDPPWRPWFLRHNEVLIDLAKPFS